MMLAQVIGMQRNNHEECIDKINNDNDDGTMVGLTGVWCVERVT